MGAPMSPPPPKALQIMENTAIPASAAGVLPCPRPQFPPAGRQKNAAKPL